MRQSSIKRDTAETKIQIELNVDGTGVSEIDTKVGFLNHMLTLFAKHGRFDLKVICDGDIDVDAHHTTEDVGIALGQAFKNAVGDKKGITRYGFFILPMDETMILTATDISGRDYLGYGLKIPSPSVGTFDTELVQEFFLGFVRNFPITLHIDQLAGTNTHHIIEGTFKSFARSLNQALTIQEEYKDEIPSTKGVL